MKIFFTDYLMPSSLIKRLIAFGIDFFLCLLLILFSTGVILSLTLSNPNNIYSAYIFTITGFLLALFYFSLSEVSGWQASIGKKIWGLSAVNLDNNKITLLQSIIKNFIKSAIITILFFYNPIIWILSNLAIDQKNTFYLLLLISLLILQISSMNEKISGTKTIYTEVKSLLKSISAIIVPLLYILSIMVIIPSLYGAKYRAQIHEKIDSKVSNFK